MASVRQIAKDAQVSIATVSRVLNNDPNVGDTTRQRVMGVVNRAGYVRRVGKRTVAEGIALAYAGPTSIGSPFDQTLLGGIGRAVDHSAGNTIDGFGNDLLIISLRRALRPNESPTQLFLRKGIKAAILRTTDEAKQLCEQIALEQFPSVVVGQRFDEDSPVSFVDAESREASREAVRHLIELGHRRIAVAANVHDDTDHRDRIAGWRDAMTEAGLPSDDRLIYRMWASLESGMQLIRRIQATPCDRRPTAMYVADPLPGFGALRAALELGLRVPGDLSLVGFDDGQQRLLMYPTMSAVCQDTVGLGKAAVELLRRRMAAGVRRRDAAADPAGPARPLRQTVPTTFEVGATTGAPDPD